MQFKFESIYSCFETENSQNENMSIQSPVQEVFISEQFSKESLEYTNYCFDFFIVQLTNTVIICCLHISCMDVQSLFYAIFTQY